MKRPVRNEDGLYHIDGSKYKNLFGSRQQVWGLSAYKTTGLLKRKDLMKNKHGRIVSKLKFYTARKEKRLERNGYFTQKGKFGYVKKSYKKGMSAATYNEDDEDESDAYHNVSYKCRGVGKKACRKDPDCKVTNGKIRKSHCRISKNKKKI